MNERNITQLLLVLTSIGLISCASRIHHIRYNPAKQAFEATCAPDTMAMLAPDQWFTMREPKTKKKVTARPPAEVLVTWYNYAADEKEKAYFRIRPTTSIHKQYKAGQLYFRGTVEIMRQEYQAALDHIKQALFQDRQLIYFSDISYLQALCYFQLQDPERAGQYYTLFSEYAELLCPAYFYLPVPDSLNTVLLVSDSTYQQGYLDTSHYARYYSGPRLPLRYFPGFIPAVGEPVRYNVKGSLLRTETGHLNIDLFLQATFPGRVRPFIGINLDQDNTLAMGGLDYWFHGSSGHRFGVHGTLRTGLVTHFLDNGEEAGNLQYWQTAAGVRAGYFIVPRWGTYLNLIFNKWNKQHQLTIIKNYTKYRVYQPHEIYLGTVIYIMDSGGINIRYDLEHELRLGFYLLGSDFLF
jgi:tetratricopeptide (TPR) repeat protein